MSYRPELESTLKEVSFEIKSRERIGIVGRTGGGKSSLLQVLFRLRELNGGRILIDGIDISTLPLHRLRRSMAIITQTPTLFTGTIRSNLLEGQGVDDDDEEKDGGENKTTITDEEMWKALRQCNMEQKVRDMELGLSTPLNDSIRLSIGEKQSIVIARALLRRSRILVLDEATASVDDDTDRHIQSLTRTLPSTLIIIAHRITTVLDLDRVIVMEAGRAVEIDTPTNLMKDQNSKFAQLVNQANNDNNQHEQGSGQ